MDVSRGGRPASMFFKNQTHVLLNLPGAAQIGGGKNPSRAEPLPGQKVAARAVSIPRVDPPLSVPQKLGALRDRSRVKPMLFFQLACGAAQLPDSATNS